MVPIRSLAGVAVVLSLLSVMVAGCGRSWIDESEIDAGTGDSGPGDGGPRDGGPDTGACDAATCPSGCCTTAGACISGSTANACGVGGAICVDCTQEGFPICDAQTHQCEDTVTNCTAASCPTGCCSGNLCIAGTSASACGNFGDVCQNCAQAGLACQGQQCTQSACGPSNCSGCCFGDQCLMGVDPSACGFGGQQCANCLEENEECVPAPETGGVCEGIVTTCNAQSCPSGCCDTSGNCESGTSPTACGTDAALCQNCLQIGATCQSQECAPVPPPCSFQTCPNGCCDANGFCEPGQSTPACGDFGQTCQNCALFGEACSGQSCNFFIDASTCGPTTCPGGCCDSSGVCQSGSQNNACGIGGNACTNCTQLAEVCDASQACEVPPPPCTPTSCANGCCDANGVCEAGFLDTACGQGGATCANCTTSGATCDTAVTPRVCNTAQMTCPATYSACPPGLTPPATVTSTSCSANDLANAAAACASGAHTTACQQFLQFEQSNNASCGACLQQFDYDLDEVQGVLTCIAPFVTDPSCENTIACLDQCEDVSCEMCSATATEQCEQSVEAGQCSTWTNQIQCTFNAFEGNGAVCNPNGYANVGDWLQAVGQTYCQ